MPTNILMPALSPTMEKGTLAKWLKKEGDQIRSGDIIAEIETDKATMEVEAVDEGVLAKIVVADGTEDVAVNATIGIIALDGEDVAAAASGAATKAEAPKSAPTNAAVAEPAKSAPVQSEPSKAITAPVANGHDRQGARVFASPLARRLAKEAGIDLAGITGSGPHGRIVERDLQAAASGKPAPKAAAQAPAAAPVAARAPQPAGQSDDAVRALFEPGSYDELPLDGMRKTIARRLTESKQTVPHFYLTVDCELDALLALRETVNKAAPLNKDGERAYKVSVNDFIVKAMAVALQHVPDANASWTETAILRHHHSDVGVAVAIPGGLITPIVRKAEQKTVSAIAIEMKDLVARARNRRLKPEEYSGGTTAVSNLGMYGVREFAAVINPPHGTILAVGAGEKRVVVKDGAPAVATVMSVTLSVDHRAVDGALGAQLLAAFKGLIERPISMLV